MNTQNKKMAIDSIERTKVGIYLRWVDGKGLQHSTESRLMLEYARDGRYGLNHVVHRSDNLLRDLKFCESCQDVHSVENTNDL